MPVPGGTEADALISHEPMAVRRDEILSGGASLARPPSGGPVHDLLRTSRPECLDAAPVEVLGSAIRHAAGSAGDTIPVAGRGHAVRDLQCNQVTAPAITASQISLAMA